MLNKSKGNMYPWVTHTWNAIKGKCPHDCSYCYMKRYPQPELHFDGKALKSNLGDGNTIFVGSSCDMWANEITATEIGMILDYCKKFDNGYLFQSKNPERFADWTFPAMSIIATTIETNRDYSFISKAPATYYRKVAMQSYDLTKMVSIEPVMDFDLEHFPAWIKDIAPQFVSIGADSGDNHLPEPSPGKLKALIESLKEFTEVKVKDNLSRLLKGK